MNLHLKARAFEKETIIVKLSRIITCTVIVILTLCLLTSSIGESNGTPEDLYNEISKFFGTPESTTARRSIFADSFGKMAMEDEMIVVQWNESKTGVWIILNRADNPGRVNLWYIHYPRDIDYQNLFRLMHDYAEGFGISEDNRCWYINAHDVNNNTFLYHVVEKPEYDMEFNDIDRYLKHIIKKNYPNLSDWYAKEFSK